MPWRKQAEGRPLRKAGGVTFKSNCITNPRLIANSTHIHCLNHQNIPEFYVGECERPPGGIESPFPRGCRDQRISKTIRRPPARCSRCRASSSALSLGLVGCRHN